jgi:hypothetical protein
VQPSLDWRDSRGIVLSPHLCCFHQCLTCTGQVLGISHGIEEIDQFNNFSFMDDVTVLARDNAGGQILLNATHEFEA